MKLLTDQALEAALSALSELSNISKETGDLPTHYAANRAWNEIHEADKDRAKRRFALEHGPRS
jgi:hypothetical protein